jgi:hypothetical protein
MRAAGPTAVTLLAPSVGVAVTIAATVFAGAIELAASGPGALALVGATAIIGYLLAVRDAR